MSEDRIHVLEQRMDTTIHRVDSKLDNIAETLQSLVRIEERQIQTSQRLTEGSAALKDHDDRLRWLEKQVPENLGKRLSSIETKIPGLLESHKWVVMGLLAGVGMVGAAVFHMVLK